MSGSLKNEIARALDSTQPKPGAKERMLANIRQKAAETAPEVKNAKTVADERLPAAKNKVLRRVLPVAVCLLIGIIGLVTIPRFMRHGGEPVGNASSTADAESAVPGLKLSFSLKEAIEMHPYIAKVRVVSDPVPTVAQQYLQEAVLEKNFRNMEESRFTLLVRDKSLKNGCSYVLFMEKQEDVFTGVTSYAYGQKIYTEGDKLFTDTITDIAGLTEDEFIARLKETTKTVSYTGNNGNEFLLGAYIHATDLPTIVSETACIAVVKVNSVRQTGDDRMMAICTADEVLKGSLTGSFQAIVPLDSVKQGDSVLLLLKRVDGIYVISSRNSVFSPDSEEAAQIRELLK